ncbi:MAG: hypothetical protein EP330_01135 [Deltaproteobacteria bacterium]|nr:MAG: hypothetical protein EP330_01135 [Deltaproteobacteria bacterium]
MTEARARMAEDLEVLAGVAGRWAGSEGEREMLHVVQQRLPAEVKARTEGFVAHVSPAFSTGLHAALLLIGGVLGFWKPYVGLLVTAAVTASLFGEGTGRFTLLRWPFPREASYNLVVRAAAGEAANGAVVIAAPLDAPRWRALDRRRWPSWRPMKLVFAAALVVFTLNALRTLGEGWGSRTLEMYVVALLVLAATVAFGAFSHRASDGRDDATAPVVALELVRRFTTRPVPGVDVYVAFTGCSRAFQGGMRAFLELHHNTLPEPCLVLALDEPGSAPLQAAVSEGSLHAQHHRPTGPALVERLRWAGVRLPMVDRGGATDARMATLMGYRALAFVGGDSEPDVETSAHAADVLETLVRWYGQDLARVPEHREELADLARVSELVRTRRRKDAEPTEETEPPATDEREAEKQAEKQEAS